MLKETAINYASSKAISLNQKQFVVWEPETYNEIFNCSGYKVVGNEHIENLEKQGFTKEVLVIFET